MINSSIYNQLNIFLAIVQEGGIRQAARKLELSPPSVSQALKRLEQHLGLPLITRTTRQMELTEAGRRLFEQASPMVGALSDTLVQINELNQVPSGKLRLTIPSFAFGNLLQPIYAEFCRMYPEIELELSISDATINLIKEGFDAGIRMAHRVEEGMVSIPLTPPIELVLCASKEYLARHGTPRVPSDLSAHQLIRYRYIAANQLAPMLLSDNGQDVTIEGRTALIVNDGNVMIDATKQGLGIGGVPFPFAKPFFADKSLVPVLQPYWRSFPALHLYFPQHSQKAMRIRVLIDFLREHAIHSW